ncbi:NAD(P)-binding domain-containing protein [Streptomyces sp. SID13031]|uniref:NADPH-dependent F420 reductase n=1 Tax=Streptomyces sp. SID13031 TaxID=2706046 RepID=UPI0013C66342|nr:NAD(P)-binding domain-containing protein [Streptomyces sp. SID13031]NEA33139.1 NAD(P)-binding domain-containing protein [Streptomyces sp. SID13031]
MRIGILGTGNLAVALGKVWAAAGHDIFVAGRSSDNATKVAGEFAGTPIDAAGLAAKAEVVVVAVAWEGLENILSLAGAPQGSLAGKTVIDCTNAVDFSTGRLKLESGSAAEFVASLAPGAHVVKALHLFAGTSWQGSGGGPKPTVAICGDDADALSTTSDLIRDLGGATATVGGLSSARQLEEAAGFVMRLVAAGHNPRSAVPDVRLG